MTAPRLECMMPYSISGQVAAARLADLHCAPPVPPPEQWWAASVGPACTTWQQIPQGEVLNYKPALLRVAGSREELVAQLDLPPSTADMQWLHESGYSYRQRVDVYRYPLVPNVTLDVLLDHPRVLTDFHQQQELPPGWCSREVRVSGYSYSLVYPEPLLGQVLTQTQRVTKRRANQITRGQLPHAMLQEFNRMLFQRGAGWVHHQAPWNRIQMDPMHYRREMLYDVLPDLARAATAMRGHSYRTAAWRKLVREAAPAVKALCAEPTRRRFGRWLAAEVRAANKR